MYIVLELGKKDLYDYLNEAIETKNIKPGTNEDFIIKIIKGAALALNQFHKSGVHGDVKAENFVVFNENEDIIEIKLIDFNISVIEGQEPLEDTYEMATNLKAPEIYNSDWLTKKADVWAFGRMAYMLFYHKQLNKKNPYEISIEIYRSNIAYNTKLDRIIKACFQKKPEDRPKMNEILSFLGNVIKYFPYEEREIELEQKREKERLENERLENERLENERLENERLENERLEKQKRSHSKYKRFLKGCFKNCF